MAIAGNNSLAAAPSRYGTLEIAITTLAVATAMVLLTNRGFLVVALFIGLAALAVVRFNWSLYATLFLLPWYPFIDWNLPVRDAFLIAHLALFAGLFVLQIRHGAAIKDWLWKGWLRKGVVSFALVASVSLVLSDGRNQEGAAKALGKLLSYTAMFLVIAAWATTREKLRNIVGILMVSTIGVCLFGFYQAAAGEFTKFYFGLYPDMEAVFGAQGGWNGRITSFLFHYNSLAGYVNAIIPFAMALTVLEGRAWWRRLGFICLAFCFAALFLTSSRGGMVACAAAVLLTAILVTPRRRTIAALMGALLLAASIVAFLPAKEGEEIRNDRLQSVDDFTIESRVALWGAAGVIFLNQPVLGAGFGEYRFAVQQYVPGIEDQLDAHNLYLQTLAETGVIGFVAFFVTMGLFLRRSYGLMKSADPMWRMVGLGVFAALAATLVHGMVDYIFIASPQFGNLFWVVLGLGVAAEEQWRSQRLTDSFKEAH